MADDRLVRIAEIEIDPAQLDAYKALLAEVGTASLALEPGVLTLNSVSLKDAPHYIRVFEVYASRAAYEAHIETPHFLKYKAATAGMVTALRLLDVDPILVASR
jgi:quinol monooxygenase YgiN